MSVVLSAVCIVVIHSHPLLLASIAEPDEYAET
jgi:hypothetical protein